MEVCSSQSCQAGGYTYAPELDEWVCAGCRRPSQRAMEARGKINNSTNHTEEVFTVANNNNFDKFLADLRDLVDSYLGASDAPVEAPKEGKAKPAKEAAPAAAGSDERRAELMKTNIRTLRKQAIELGFDEEEVADAEKDDLVDSILSEEEEAEEQTEAEGGNVETGEDDEAEVEEAEGDDDEEEEEEEEDDDEEEEDEDEAEEYSREDLEGMKLPALKKIAKEEFGETTASLKGLDSDAVIDLILGEGDEDAEEDEEEDEDEGLTAEDMEDMSLAEVKAIAKENGVKVKVGMKKEAIIDAIFAE